MTIEYEMMKDLLETKQQVSQAMALLDQCYAILEHNIKNGKLEEPKK